MTPLTCGGVGGHGCHRLPGCAAFKLGTKVEGPDRDQDGAGVPAVGEGPGADRCPNRLLRGHGASIRGTAGRVPGRQRRRRRCWRVWCVGSGVGKPDSIDRRILRALQENDRIQNIELADKVGLSPSPCLRRVKMVEEAGVIERCVAAARCVEDRRRADGVRARMADGAGCRHRRALHRGGQTPASGRRMSFDGL